MTVLAPAKINLHLEIIARRPDGYHELRSIFLKVGLYDIVTVERTGKNGKTSVVGNPGVSPESDLMYVAAETYRESAGIEDGISIRIRKRIPLGSGLGGGSSDAASVLMCLDSMYDGAVPELPDLAKEIGSDVPFFFGTAASFVTGRGERLEPLETPRRWWTLIVAPGFVISTRDAFSWYDRHNPDRGAGGQASEGEIRNEFLNPAGTEFPFRNDFASVLYDRYPELDHICSELGPCRLSGVTGSGSGCFGLYDSYAAASAAAAKLEGYRFWCVPTLRDE